MDWATATFFDRVVHGLWLDPEDVRVRYDLQAIENQHRPLNERIVKEWREIAPGSDATVIEFDFWATGNAKRKLLRRIDWLVTQRRGGFKIWSATSLHWLPDYALAYEVLARECGGALIGWRFVSSPIPEG